MRVLMVHPHDIYDPLEPWTIRITSLARCLGQLGHEVKVVYHLSRSDLLPGDLLLTMGAGSVEVVAPQVLALLEAVDYA